MAILAMIIPIGDVGGGGYRPDNSLPMPPTWGGGGGQPIFPSPPGIWGGGVPVPMPPIAMPPIAGWPGVHPPPIPPGIWGGGVPMPMPPIYLPPEEGGGGEGEGGVVTNPIYKGGMVLVWVKGVGWALVPIGGSGEPIASGGGGSNIKPPPTEGQTKPSPTPTSRY